MNPHLFQIQADALTDLAAALPAFTPAWRVVSKNDGWAAEELTQTVSGGTYWKQVYFSRNRKAVGAAADRRRASR